MIDWKEIGQSVAKVAPMLGGLLGGPGGAAVGSIIASALGVDNTPSAVKEALQSNPDAAVKIAQIESDERVKLQQMTLESANRELETAAADRKSARELLLGSQSRIPATLSLLVTAGYFGILIGLMADVLKLNDSQAMMMMVGSLTTAWGIVMAFWFGTTMSSARKTDIIAASPGVK